ncbi:hypothetical protein LP421_33120 (plasmid) [Rhizobium sp. RCAM05350]|uniref:hypothetical protein n=1 Tax=Rhizobium sp. RCAM05350 TaxID=2895568 RepID=UPI0020768682|nr:hypothetical protein [Rhizobium sp. RCAM05350]URK89500.1 hypothetical protein LP421_33120 [Rhizobium sp. RCAM05350]
MVGVRYGFGHGYRQPKRVDRAGDTVQHRLKVARNDRRFDQRVVRHDMHAPRAEARRQGQQHFENKLRQQRAVLAA